MVRAFDPRPVDRAVLEGLLALATRAPSAGHSQGWTFVVLRGGSETSRFWDATLAPERRADFAWPGLLDAPVLVLPFADPQAYLERYGEPDKAATGLGGDIERWPVPYWLIDTAFATMTLLHGAVDAGLGALFFGVFRGEQALRDALGVPPGPVLLGAVALGHPLPSRAGRSAGRPRRPESQVVRWGSWTPALNSSPGGTMDGQ